MDVRRATPGDLDALTPLFSAYRRHFNASARAQDSRPFLEARMAADECVVFVAEHENTPCGFIQLYPLWSSWYCRRIWFLSDLYVDERFRHLGAGKALVERVKAFAAESGASSVMVELPHSEPHLAAFYDALGFARDDVFDLARFYPS